MKKRMNPWVTQLVIALVTSCLCNAWALAGNGGIMPLKSEGSTAALHSGNAIKAKGMQGKPSRFSVAAGQRTQENSVLNFQTGNRHQQKVNIAGGSGRLFHRK